MRNAVLGGVFFGLSAVLTWAFVAVSPVYLSPEQMLLSTLVAGGKWGIQIGLALALLGGRAWLFIRNIGAVCLVGSVVLVPYAVAGLLGLEVGGEGFCGSLAVAVAAMIGGYFRAVRSSGVALGWWYGWLGCLAVAVTLQLTVVFQVF
jgi:hypothetical protein